MTRSKNIRIRAALVPLAMLLALTVLAAPADAAQHRSFSESFGASGSGVGQLSLLFPELFESEKIEAFKPVTAGSGIAVDDASGDVYVADTLNHRVSEFDPAKPDAERFVRAFGADVGGVVGGVGVDICTTTCQTGTSGSEPGELMTPTFIAVDNSKGVSHGDIYVADTAGTENRISKFNAEGELQTSWGQGGQLDGSSVADGPFGLIQGIATDTEGNLWVRGGGGSVLFEFDQTGAFVREWETELASQPTGIAVDGAEPGHLYLLDGFPWGPIHRVTASGTDEGAILGTIPGFFTGIAVDQRTHDLFAGQQGVSIADVPPGCAGNTGSQGPTSEGFCTPTQVLGEGNLDKAAGLGVDSASGTLYAASTETDQVAVFPVTLEGVTEPASNITSTTAIVHGNVDPKKTPVTHCKFQYGEGESYGQEVPCLNSKEEEVGTTARPIGSSTEVHAELDPINGGATYHFRLRLGNEKAEFLSTEDVSFKTLAIAVVSGVKAEPAETSARLSAMVNPEGVTGATCMVEWGTSTAYTGTVPCEPQSLGSGSSPVEVKAELTGLAPETTYHFNFSVKDADGTTLPVDHTFVFTTSPAFAGCPNEALRGENDSSGLPDCRAYELVTPMDKNGALIGGLFVGNIPPQISADGDRVIAPSIQCFAGALSCVGTRVAEGEPFQFERGPSGWAPQALTIPASVYETSSAWGFNAETGSVLFGAPSAPNNQDDWYVRVTGGAVSNLGPLSEANVGVQTTESEPIVTTNDFSHVMWVTTATTWKFDETEDPAKSVYEYPGVEGSTSAPQLVAVSGGADSHDLIGTCGAEVAGFETVSTTDGTLSADGRTSYFQVEPCAHGSGVNESNAVPAVEIFARIDGEGPQARTVAISEPDGLSTAEPDPACTSSECIKNTRQAQSFRGAGWAGASTDGTMAYFTSPQQLTDSGSQDPDAADTARRRGCTLTQGPNGCNLYLFEDPQQQPPLSGTHLVDVSAGDTSGIGPEVQGMLALSTDGTHAYFVAKGVLSEAGNAMGEHAVEGANNLYLYERDEAHPQGQLTFITTLADANKASWSPGARANVTPDGRYLVFESTRGLTPGARLEGASQIYRYDAVTNRLERLSFGRHGFNDDGNAGKSGADATLATVLRTALLRSGPVRSDPTMSDDGSVVFFQSPVSLTPGALSEEPAGTGGKLAQNIYEWEQQGSGSCTEEGGCVYLISDGKDTTEPGKTVLNSTELLGVDPSGQNVFIATASRLNWADTDTQRDYYDVRVDGGFPAPAEEHVCEGEECHSAGTVAPIFGPLASLTFTGPGNPLQETIKLSGVKPKTPAQIRAEKLSKALKQCKKLKRHKKRKGCEQQAHKRYGAKAAHKINTQPHAMKSVRSH